MARLRRIPYTKPIPAGAEIVTHKGKPHARFKDEDGRTTTAPLTRKGDRIRLLSKKWYGEFKGADGSQQCVPLSTDKVAAGQMLADLVKKAELGKAGIVDPFEEHRQRPLASHLGDWQDSLLAGGASAKHVRQTVACADRVIRGCGFTFMADLSASRVQSYLAELRERPRALPPFDPEKAAYTKAELAGLLGVKASAVPALVRQHRLQATGNGKARRYPRETAEALRSLRTRGRSIKTSNLYLDAMKQFAAWLVQDRRTAENPLTHLSGGNVKLDRRHDRRALPADELRAVILAAGRSASTFRRLTGQDRATLYSVACVSGFRAEELASLFPRAFDLDGDSPTVTLAAENAKNGKTAVQPLPPDVTEALRGYLAGRPADQPLWPGTWFKKAAEMLRIELDVCGIPYAVEGPDGPLYADFHALRHSYIAMLDKAGVSLKQAMQLARHSDPKLTMAVYGRAQLHDLASAVDRLPSLVPAPPETLAATGTDGKLATREVSSLRSACANGEDSHDHRTKNENALMGEGAGDRSNQPPAEQRVEEDSERVSKSETSSPTRTRTWNKPVNSRKHQDHKSKQGNTSDQPAVQLSAQLAQQGPVDPALARISDAWPNLPEHIRAAVLALVEAAGRGG
jgi:integrase